MILFSKIYFFLVAAVFVLGCSSKHSKIPGKAQDTLFIFREATKDFYHAIFIEKSRNSEYYKYLSDTSFENYDNPDANLEELIKKQGLLKKFNTQLPDKWIPLYLYKNNYYVYKPADPGAYLDNRILSDSLVWFWSMEGPYPYALNSFQKVNNTTFKITTENYFPGGWSINPEELNLYLVDKKKRVFVWEFKNRNDKDYSYRLYTPAESIKNFDVVVNFYFKLENRPPPEIPFFDKIDFPALLKQVKNTR